MTERRRKSFLNLGKVMPDGTRDTNHGSTGGEYSGSLSLSFNGWWIRRHTCHFKCSFEVPPFRLPPILFAVQKEGGRKKKRKADGRFPFTWMHATVSSLVVYSIIRGFCWTTFRNNCEKLGRHSDLPCSGDSAKPAGGLTERRPRSNLLT